MADFERAFKQEHASPVGEKIGEDVYRYSAQYLGGHKLRPHGLFCDLYLHPKEMVIEELDLRIPYSEIKEVKNLRLSTERETCLSIAYYDGLQDQNLIFRIKGLDDAQTRLYKSVLEAKKSQKAQMSSALPLTSQSKYKEIIKEKEVIIKVRCSYCHNLYDETLDKCPHCGGRA
jgi:hypothetical protein